MYHRKLWFEKLIVKRVLFPLDLLPKSFISTQLKNSCGDISMYRGSWSLQLIISCVPADKGTGIPLDKLNKVNYSLKDALTNFAQVPKHILKWCRFETHLWTPWSVSSMLPITLLCVFDTDKLTAPFNTSQQAAWYSTNIFPGFVFGSCRAQFLNLHSLLFFPLWSWGENFPLWWVDCCCLPLSSSPPVADAQLV